MFSSLKFKAERTNILKEDSKTERQEIEKEADDMV